MTLGLFDEIAQVGDRVMAGINYQDLDRVEGDKQVYELPGGRVESHLSVTVKGRAARFGISPGWRACDADELTRIPGPDHLAGTTVCAALYPQDARPQYLGSIQVLSMRGKAQLWQRRPDPELWLLRAERQHGLRALGRVTRVRFAGDIAYLWLLGGTMAGATLGFPGRAAVDIRSCELWFPLMDGMLKLLLVAPPERFQEGYEMLCTVICSWQWDEGQA
jgi:hypothetical protein